MPVVTPDQDDEFGAVAAEIADRRDERVHADVPSAGAGELLYVAGPMALTEHRLLALQRRLADRGPSAGSFGVITGLTPERALALYERAPSESGTHCVMLRKEDRDVRSPDDRTEVLTRETATVDRFERLADEGIASLSTMTDGQSIHTFLSDGYLCGFPSAVDVTAYDDPQPNCVVDGERDCPLEGGLVPVDELSIPHVFLNSCTSMVPANSSRGLPVHVGMGLLRGATSLIGGYRPMHGLAQEAALHHALLRAGRPAAERCYLLNRNAHATNLKAYPYATFGRPEATVADPVEPEATVEVVAGDETLVRCRDVSAHVVDVTVPGAAVDGPSPALQNDVEAQADWPLYYAAFPEDDGVRVLVYSWGRIETDELRFRLVGDEPRVADHEVLRSSLSNVRGLERLGLLDRKARGQLRNLRNRVAGLADDEYRRRYDANAYRVSGGRLDGVLEDLTNVRERLVSILDGRGPGFLSEDYDDRVVKTGVGTAEEDCYDCGRPVFTTRVADVSRAVERWLGFCPYCINVFDVPAVGDAPAHPRVLGDLTLAPAARTEVTVEFTNPLDRTMEATVFPWLWSNWEEYRGEPVFTPGSTTTRLGPGETHAAPFELDVAPLAPETYSVYAYVVGNLDVYLSCRKLVVADGG